MSYDIANWHEPPRCVAVPPIEYVADEPADHVATESMLASGALM